MALRALARRCRASFSGSSAHVFLRNYTTVPSHLRAPTSFNPAPPTKHPLTIDTEEEIELLAALVANLAEKGVAGSSWNINSLVDLGVCWEPTNDVDSVLPKEYEPTDEELGGFSTILSQELNGKSLRKSSNTWGLGSSLEKVVALKLQRLLTNPNPLELLDLIGVGDPEKSCAVYNMKMEFETQLGDVRYSTTPDYTVFIPHLHKWMVITPIEDKRLRPTEKEEKAVEAVMAQMFSEMLAGAVHNFCQIGGAQEMFCVGVRKQYFTFMHVNLPEAYIAALRHQDPQIFTDQRVLLRSYPASLYGLDFVDPVQRRMIFQFLFRIIKYCTAKYSKDSLDTPKPTLEFCNVKK